MVRSTKELIEEKEAAIRKLQNEIEILKSLPSNDFCSFDLPLALFDDLDIFIVRYLERAEIITVKDLISKSKYQVLHVRRIGPQKLEIIEQWLKKHNLQLLD